MGGVGHEGTVESLLMRMSERLRRMLARVSQEMDFYKAVLKHPRTPRASRILLGAALAYAVSPIDLIPDFIPVVGYFDDLLVLPTLIWLAFRLVPNDVVKECREQLRDRMSQR